VPTLFKRPSSPYWYFKVQKNGKEFWRSTRETNKSRADARVAGLLNAVSDRAYGNAGPTKDEWVGVWWDTYWADRSGAMAVAAVAKSAYVERLLGNQRLRQLRPSHFTAYIKGRRQDGAADSTISLEGRLLKQCLRAAVEEGHLEKLPFGRSVQWPKIAIRERVLSHGEQEALLCELPEEQQQMVLVAVNTGLRGAELCGITIEQIDWTVPSLAIKGKGNKKREVPVFAPALPALAAAVGSRSKGRLWPRKTTPTQTVTTVNHMLRRAWARTGELGTAPTTHVFRHTFATRFLTAGGDIYILSKILGHASVAVTERVYAHLLTETITRRALTVQMS
jgi:integrase/recombinase XerD